MSMEILLGEETFRAIQIIDLAERLDTPEHRVEKQFEIVDHLITKPAEFELELELDKYSNEHLTLFELYQQKTPIQFVAGDFGVYDDMVIDSIKLRQGGSVNTLIATVHLKQILTAYTQTVELPDPFPADGTQDDDDVPGSDHSNPPDQDDNPSAPIYDGWMAQYMQQIPQTTEENDEQEQTWLDTIFTWLDSFFGGD